MVLTHHKAWCNPYQKPRNICRSWSGRSSRDLASTGYLAGADHSLCLFIDLRSLHLLIVGVTSVLFSRRDTQGPRCSSVFQVLYEISISVSWHLKGVKKFKLNAPQLLPVVSWNSTYQPASAVNKEKPRACSPLPNFSNNYHAIHEVSVVAI